MGRCLRATGLGRSHGGRSRPGRHPARGSGHRTLRRRPPAGSSPMRWHRPIWSSSRICARSRSTPPRPLWSPPCAPGGRPCCTTTTCPWQRPHLAHMPPPPDDPSWAHVTINDLSRRELAAHDITATTIYNSFDPNPVVADRERARRIARRGRGDPAPPAADACTAAQEHRRRAGSGRRRGRDVLAPRSGRGRLRPRARPAGRRRPVPGAARAGRAAGLTIAEAYAACDVVAAALHLGGVRQPLPRIGHPPPASGHRALPGGPRAGRLRVPLVRQCRARPPRRVVGPPRRRRSWHTITGSPPPTSTWPTSLPGWPTCWPAFRRSELGRRWPGGSCR